MQNSMTISQNGVYSLSIVKKWSKVLSICGFILSGLSVLFGFLMMVFLNKIPQAQGEAPFPTFIFLVLYATVGVIYYFPSYYLFKFSSHLHNAIESGLESNIDDSLKHLRSFFTYIGILTLISLGFAVLFLIIGISVSLFMPLPTNGINT